MKDQIRIIAILLGVIILVAEIAYSKVESVPVCDPENSISKQNTGIKINLVDLPKIVLIASESIQEIIGKGSMVVSRQSFIKPQSKVECASFAKVDQRNYSILAPVLIDLTLEQKTKNSYWQFQTMVQENKVGIWNQKTILMNQNYHLNDWVKSQNSEIEFFQTNHEQIMMQIRQKEKEQTIIQRVFFDMSSD